MEISNIPLYLNTFSKGFLRSRLYTAEFQVLNLISTFNGFPLREKRLAKKYLPKILREVFATYHWHSKNIAEGVYPSSVDEGFSVYDHITNFSKVLLDFPSVVKRRKENDTVINNKSDYPKYFTRNFHFQTDGYLSQKSADLYDTQVEILFGGAGNVMRCLLLSLLDNHIKDRRFHALELASGTGKGTDLLKKKYPYCVVDVSDISDFYVKKSRETLKDYQDLNFLVEDATKVSLKENSKDLVFHIFLFHEMPLDERKQVIKEMLRIMKLGAHGVIVDSSQIVDMPHFQEVLEDFPKKYHEPFYRNYIQHPIEELVSELGGKVLEKQVQLFSKGVIFTKQV